MVGYIINLFKQATAPSNLKVQLKQIMQKNESGNKKTLSAYGEVDRLQVSKVMDFTRYRDVSQYAKKWIGLRQSVLLYQIGEDGKDILDECFTITTGEKNENKNIPSGSFIILTMVMLDPRVNMSENFSGTLKKYRTFIHRKINEVKEQKRGELISPENIDCEVYGSFSSSALAIVWKAREYVDVMHLIDTLRNISIKVTYTNIKKEITLFTSVYSIVTQYFPGETSTTHELCNIKGSAEISFIYQNAQRTKYYDLLMKEIKKKATEKEVQELIEFQRVGEYDESIRLPASLLCNPSNNFFAKNGMLNLFKNNENSPKFNNISRTKTQLYYKRSSSSSQSSSGFSIKLKNAYDETNDIPLGKWLTEVAKKVYGTEEKKVFEEDWPKFYEQHGIRELLKRFFPQTVGLCDTIDLLYTDYVNDCTNLENTAWCEDISKQFMGVIDYLASSVIKYFCCKEIKDKTNFFGTITQITDDLKQIIYHVSQSGRTFFVMPNCHFRYLGQYDMILHAYYGFEKFLLKCAELVPRNDKQPKLIPLFTADVVPEIKTHMYKISVDCSSEGPKGIFSVNIPISGMTDFLRYAIMITHETTHFITPIDRNKRNQILGMLFFSEFLVKSFLREIESYYFEERDKLIDACYKRLVIGLIPYCYDNFRAFYQKYVHNEIKDSSPDTGETFANWQMYHKKMIQQFFELFLDSRKDPNIGKCIHNTFKNDKEKLQKKISSILSDISKAYEAKNGSPMSEDIIKKLEIKALNKVLVDYSLDFFDFTDIDWNHMLEISNVISQGYQEACQDIPMIRFFNLSVVDYLVLRDRHRNDISQLGQLTSENDQLRVALICDYLITNSIKTTIDYTDVPFVKVIEKLKSLRKEYEKLMFCVPEMKANDLKEEKKKEELIKKAFDLNITSLENSCLKFSIFRELLLTQLADSDISRVKNLETVLSNSKLPQYYQEWKSAIQCEAKEERESRIFTNSLNMIHEFQN